MKVAYILSMSHSGSTLLDCILGTHDSFFSSGELKYINWQLFRTKNSESSIEKQNICTCGNSFRTCSFWSEVFSKIKEQSSIDISENPLAFNTFFFNHFSHQNKDGFVRKKTDAYREEICRRLLAYKQNLMSIRFLEPGLYEKLRNNWLLYETMHQVSGKEIIIDSSKNMSISLLLKSYKPTQVYHIFLHRDPLGLLASYKKWAKRGNKPFNITNALEMVNKYERRIAYLKKKLKATDYIDVHYENITKQPISTLNEISTRLETNLIENTNDKFFINPKKLHIVAGNPMRYRGKQEVKHDETWRNILTIEEIETINDFKKKHLIS